MIPGAARTFAGALLLSLAACRGSSEPRSEPALVRTVPAERGSVTSWVRLNGRVVPAPDHDAVLAPLVAGRLVSVAVREGDLVHSGQLLASVDPAPLEDALRGAEAALRRASADARFRRGVADTSAALLAKGALSREESESDEEAAIAAETARDEASALLAIARRHRAWATLTAPFDGSVVRVLRRRGEEVDGSPATPVVEVAAPSPWEVEASATGESLDRLRRDQRAGIRTSAEPSLPWLEARVEGVGQMVDPETGAGGVRLRPVGSPEPIALGTPLEVRVAVETRESVVVVPSAALRPTPAGGFEVVVVERDIAHVREVTTGVAEDDRVEITAGLDAGARVVVEDPLALADATPVRERS